MNKKVFDRGYFNNRFLNDNYIPKNQELKFSEENFEKFWTKRKAIMASCNGYLVRIIKL